MLRAFNRIGVDERRKDGGIIVDKELTREGPIVQWLAEDDERVVREGEEEGEREDSGLVLLEDRSESEDVEDGEE